MSYQWQEMHFAAQMGCDLRVCKNKAYGFAQVDLKDQSLGGFRERLYLALCLDHLPIGVPVTRGAWVRDEEVN